MAREVWSIVCTALNKPGWVPTGATNLVEWCAEKNGASMSMKELRTIILLVMWELSKHRNAIVFDGATPSLRVLLQTVEREGWAWKDAGRLKGDVGALLRAVARWESMRE